MMTGHACESLRTRTDSQYQELASRSAVPHLVDHTQGRPAYGLSK